MPTKTPTRIPRPRALGAIITQFRLPANFDHDAPVAEVMTERELAVALAPKGRAKKTGNAGMARVPAPRNPSRGVLATPTSIEHAARLLDRLYASDPAIAQELAADLTGKNQAYVSRVIDNLMALLAMEPPAVSDAQKRYATSLYTARLSVGDAELDGKFAAALDAMTKDEARRLIDTLTSLPTRNRNDIPAKKDGEALHAVTEGMYRLPNGEIYKVQKAVHGSGQLYAKKLVKLDEPTTVRGKEAHYAFEMARGAIRQLRPEHRMTREDAKKFGDLYGCCCRCGTVLTDEESIARGIGPVCADKF